MLKLTTKRPCLYATHTTRRLLKIQWRIKECRCRDNSAPGYLEVTFLFPWCIKLGHISHFGFWSMAVFLLILTIGFIYEWKKGALNW